MVYFDRGCKSGKDYGQDWWPIRALNIIVLDEGSIDTKSIPSSPNALIYTPTNFLAQI
jgi:hypothetical protein